MGELDQLRDRHRKLYFEMLGLGHRIRELELAEPKPETRVDLRKMARQKMWLEVLAKVGFIDRPDREAIPDEDLAAAWKLLHVREDLLRRIATKLRVYDMGDA